jgi:hypothetical protein
MLTKFKKDSYFIFRKIGWNVWNYMCSFLIHHIKNKKNVNFPFKQLKIIFKLGQCIHQDGKRLSSLYFKGTWQ